VHNPWDKPLAGAASVRCTTDLNNLPIYCDQVTTFCTIHHNNDALSGKPDPERINPVILVERT